MLHKSTLVQLISLVSIALFAQADEYVDVRVRGKIEDKVEKTSPFSLFFDPLKNSIRLDRQKIDYDLTKETVLRLGPYLLEQSSVAAQMTRELGEFYEIDFGFDISRRVGPIYIISFNWPIDFIPNGFIEMLDDSGSSLWRRKLSSSDIEDWRNSIDGQRNKSIFERKKVEIENELANKKDNDGIEAYRKKLSLARPQNLSPVHLKSQFGLSHKTFYEIPMTQITAPFRFCVSKEEISYEVGKKDALSRLAVCSRRYRFLREAGRYQLLLEPKIVKPIVLINDKPVTLKGTAIFIEEDIPIKFAAMLKNGTYFEFVSNPKTVRIVDMAKDEENKRVNIIGYGDAPMGQIDESFYADSVHWGFLNFMPTIGDLRKFWRATVDINAPYLYLKGAGGAPFRQNFDFENMPSVKARVVLSDKTTKSTYSSSVWVSGKVDKSVKLSADGAEIRREEGSDDFEWELPTPQKGVYNKGIINVHEGDKKWMAEYEIFRSYPAEISARLSGVLTKDLTLVVMGEVAAQYWFESVLGWGNYYLAHQRWGLSARYFESLVGTDADLLKFAAGTVDLKYRFTPGVWGRDPTVGMMGSFLNFDYGFKDSLGSVMYHVPVVGGGAFWARSMPKVFDDILNLFPFMRYTKWVDWEFIYYPLALREKQTSTFMFAMNFHGKIQWTQKFFGEAGFGLKNFSFEDVRSPDPNKQLAPQVVIAFGTLGLGFNF